jgi:hypothetical protein
MEWERTHIDLGGLKEKTTVNINYNYLGSKVITEVKPSCPKCSTASYNDKTKQVEVVYSTGKLPRHLTGTFYHVTIEKRILVKYEDGTEDILSFSGKIIK